MLDGLSIASSLERHLDKREHVAQQEQNVPHSEEQLLHEAAPVRTQEADSRRSLRGRTPVNRRSAVCVPRQVVLRRRDEELQCEQQRRQVVRHSFV